MKEKRWYPYFKPTRRKHDSGFRMCETGYIQLDGTKYVIGECSDVIDINSCFSSDIRASVDVLSNGCVRIFDTSGDPIRWLHEGYAISSAQLTNGEPNIIK